MEKIKVSLTNIASAIPSAEDCEDFQVLVRLEAPAAEGKLQRRASVDIVTVLDVGRSMGRQAAPLLKKTSRLDLLKRAMKFVITQLHDDDNLAIVAFNSKVLHEHTTGFFQIAGARMYAEKMVGELAAKGETALQPGLEHAVKILEERPGKANRPGFILLLTDGVDNSKTKWNEEHMNQVRRDILRKYPVHTFGFGVAHDPETLLFIAQESNGGTYSLVDEENLDKITDALAICLGGFPSVCAFDVDIRVSTNASNGNLTSIDSGFYESDTTKQAKGSGGFIKVGSLYAGEVMNFILHFHLLPDSSYTNLYSVDAKYKVTPGGSTYVYADYPSGYQTISRPTVVVDPKRPPLQVLEQILRFKVLDMVASLLQETDEFKAGLKNIENDRASTLLLRSKWEDLKTEWTAEEDIIGHCHLDVRHGLEDEIGEMVTRIKEGNNGVAYICAWLSSNGVQRATTMGSSNDIATCLSLTPSMKAMLEESDYFQSAVPVELESSGEAAAAAAWPPTTQWHMPKPQQHMHMHMPMPQQAPAAVVVGTVPLALETTGGSSWIMEQRLEAWSKVQREFAANVPGHGGSPGCGRPRGGAGGRNPSDAP